MNIGRLYLFFIFALLAVRANPASAESLFCPQIYDPVCASVQVQCIKAPCEPILKTFSNRCMAQISGENVRVLYKGECKNKKKISLLTSSPGQLVEKKYKMPENCAVWFDGCNICSRETKNSSPVCTLRACLGEPQKPYCKKFFSEKESNKGGSNPEGVVVSNPKAETDLIKDMSLSEMEKLKNDFKFYSYANGEIFLNIKEGDTLKNELFDLIGFVNPKKPHKWMPTEASSGFCQIKSEKGEMLGSFIIDFKGQDWMTLASAGQKLWFGKKINLSALQDGLYYLECKNSNPSGLPENDAKIKINFKLQTKQSETGIQTGLKNMEQLMKEIKERHNAESVEVLGETVIVKKKEQIKLFGIFPLKITVEMILDKDLVPVQVKRPWWAVFGF